LPPKEPVLRIIFAGTPEFAAVSLQGLLASEHSVCAVYSQPDRPAGRGRKLRASPVKQLAEDKGIAVFQPASLKDEQVLTQLSAHQADVMVVVAYGLILPPSVLDIPRLGCVNIHASLLPRWRGAAPIQRAIMAGDTETGITIIQMDAGLDTGPMLVRTPCPIDADDTAQSLHDKLAPLGATAVVTALNQLASGTAQPEPQDEAKACYAHKIDKQEAWIDWNKSADEIVRQIRAFNAWPIARCWLDGKALHVWRAVVAGPSTNAAPGTVTAVDDQGIDVATGTGAVRLLELQIPGKKPLSVAQFLNARRLTPGTRLVAADSAARS
jgi:methionyl-tRNA formyltransferase